MPGIPAENFLIGATHTHSAPDCYGFPDGKGGTSTDPKYLELVCRRMAEAINEGLYLVPEMSRAEMRKAIIQPIVQAGGEIVSPLVDRMLNDLDGRTDQLPVLQHALMRMWNRREPGEPLSPADYTEVGGFSECLSNHAGKLFEDLPKEQQPVAMALFKAITETTPDNRQVRRQSTAKAVAAATGYSIERLRPAAEAFSEGGTGFVVVSPSPMAEWSILDISHEALIRQWRLLRGWVEEEGTARRAVDRLEEVADEWKKKTAEDDRIAADYLLRGARLEATQLVANRPGFVASPATTEFLAASRNAENRSVRKRRLGWFLLVSIGLGVFIYASETRISLVRSEKIAVESEKKVVEDDRKAARDQLADVAQRVETVCGTSYGPAAGAPDPICSELRKATLSKRVFLQIGSEARMAAAKHCADQLSKAGFGVHGIELVHDVPETTQVRYFSEGDHGQADDIAVRLGACGEPGAKVVKLEDARAGPGLIEIWFRTSALKLETRVNAKDGLVYVLIPKGTGLLGCPAADPECKPGQATIQNPFWIGQTEVTQAAFDKLMGANPSKFRDPALPADSVTWDEAVSYCAAAGGRLPAEAEWEYAARAGSTGPHYGPADSVAWYGATSSGHPHTPRGKSKNAFGLYDTLGNLWEWTADEYVQAYQKPSVPPKYRALRGGAWNSDLGLVQLSIRNGTYPSARRNDFGFRCVTDKLP